MAAEPKRKRRSEDEIVQDIAADNKKLEQSRTDFENAREQYSSRLGEKPFEDSVEAAAKSTLGDSWSQTFDVETLLKELAKSKLTISNFKAVKLRRAITRSWKGKVRKRTKAGEKKDTAPPAAKKPTARARQPTPDASYFVVAPTSQVYEAQTVDGKEVVYTFGRRVQPPLGERTAVFLDETEPDLPPEYYIVALGQNVSLGGQIKVFVGKMQTTKNQRVYAVLFDKAAKTWTAVDPLALRPPPTVESCIGCGVQATVACSACAMRFCEGACAEEHLSECTE
jgi:hypothetical protein